MVSDKRVQEAMNIILHAGNARAHCTKALKYLEVSDIELAKHEMELANQDIVQAHKIQTNAISSETQGDPAEYSVLFAHAQDTLMTIYSELNIAKRLINIMDHYNQRINKLEKRLTKLETVEETDTR
ncbi:PTS lactose/cellobiose transporter subunit IIA [Amphibacillus sp. Q70]|uniref:PTS lactose/cellobiose transporter subunit IIA n=1 Tax=Amphibacillus sp. Q70 TaxID=3453416 RepID=UPI003F82DAAF